MFDSSTTESVKHAWIVDEAWLRRVHGLIDRSSLEPTISVTFANGVNRTVEDINALVSLQNGKRLEITKIEFDSFDFRAEENGKKMGAFRVRIEKGILASISYMLKGEFDAVSQLKSEMDDLIEGAKPWYSFIYEYDVFMFLATLTVVNFGFLFAFGDELSTYLENATSDEMSGGTVGLVFFVVYTVSVSLFIFGLSRLSLLLLPETIIALGQQEGRYQALKKVQYFLLVAILLPIGWFIVNQNYPSTVVEVEQE